jgi:hypothetical protein
MRRKSAIAVVGTTVVALPTAIYGFATAVTWPNSTYEALFETVDSPMIVQEVVSQRLKAQGYEHYAASFVDVRNEAQFAARVADIKRRGGERKGFAR